MANSANCERYAEYKYAKEQERRNIVMPDAQQEYSAKPVSMTFGTVRESYSQPVYEMVGIAAGQQHTMILSKDGGLYSWGLGLCG